MAQHSSFAGDVRDGLRRAPWLLVSVALHGSLLLVLANVEWSQRRAETGPAIFCGPIDLPEVRLEEYLPVQAVAREDPVPVSEPVVAEEVTLADGFVETAQHPALAPLSWETTPTQPLIGVGGGSGGRGCTGGPTICGPRQSSLNGLRWLRNHQDPAGFWDGDGFADRCQTNVCDGRGSALHDVGLTGLALLAFLGAGQTLDRGEHAAAVRKGMRWLVQGQDPDDGCLAPRSGSHFLYDHALATLAVVEAYHLSSAPHLRGPAQAGLDFIARARNPGGGWRYAYPPDGDEDLSVSGWMLFALYAGRDAGLAVDAAALHAGLDLVNRMTDGTTGRAGYRARGSRPARDPGDAVHWPPEESESLTAVALLLRCFAGQDLDAPGIQRGLDLLGDRPPRHDVDAGSIDYYYWYYGTYVMWQASGQRWNRWQKALHSALVRTQRQDGDEAGSWDPQVDPWGDIGGRVYATAINTLCLEVYYRYDRLWGAR